MKILLLVILLFVLGANISFPQTGWVAQNSGITQNINAIQFIDGNTGWAVGNAGVVLNTTNGGTNWSLINTGYTSNLYCLQVYSNTILFAGSDYRSLLRSDDGGVSWVKLHLTSDNEPVQAVYFNNSLTGYIAFNAWLDKTTNGGANFSSVITETYINSIFFIPGTNKGYAVGFGYADYPNYNYTTDGRNWYGGKVGGNTATLNSIHFITVTVSDNLNATYPPYSERNNITANLSGNYNNWNLGGNK